MDVETPGEILKSLLGNERGQQAALARACHVRPQTVTKWLSEQIGIPIYRWPEIEAFLGVPPLTFARRSGIFETLPGLEEAIPTDHRYAAHWAGHFATGYSMTTRPRRQAEAATQHQPQPSGADLDDHEARIKKLEEQLRNLQEHVALLVERAVKDESAGTRSAPRARRVAQ